MICLCSTTLLHFSLFLQPKYLQAATYGRWLQAEQQRPQNRKRWHSFRVFMVGQGRRRQEGWNWNRQSEEFPGGRKREKMVACERARCGSQALKGAESAAGCWKWESCGKIRGFKDLREKEKKHCEQKEKRPGADPWRPPSLVHIHLTHADWFILPRICWISLVCPWGQRGEKNKQASESCRRQMVRQDRQKWGVQMGKDTSSDGTS